MEKMNARLAFGDDTVTDSVNDVSSKANTTAAAVPSGPVQVPRSTEQPKRFINSNRPTNYATEKSADEALTNIISLVRRNGLPINTAANMIVGRIRSILILGIRAHSDQTMGFEIESFKYLDSILFDDLAILVESIIKYGSKNNIPMGNVIKMITDSASLIDYFIPDEDFTKIKNAVMEIYNAF